MNRFLNVIDRITGKTLWAMYLLIPMSAILIYEIIIRTAYHTPTIWSFETSAFIFGAFFILAMAYTLKSGGHVSVDIVTAKMSGKARKYLALMASGVILFVAAVVVARGIPHAISATITREGSASYWNPVLFPIRWVMVLGYILLLLEALRQTLLNIKALRE